METVTNLNVLDKVSSEVENVSKIREQLFSVIDINVPKPPIKNINPENVELPDTKLVYNSHGRFLGHVGRIYQSLQPEMFLDSLLGTLEGCGDDINLDLSKLEYRELRDGKVIEFRLPTETVAFKNNKGKADEIKLFINFLTGFGGYQRSEMGLYSKRVICTNGMKIIQSETELRAKHTERMNKKVEIYCQELLKTLSKVQETTKLWKEMDSKAVNDETVKRFAEKIAGISPKEKVEEISTRKKNILSQVNEAIAQEFQVTGATVWGLLNGATRYTNHFASGHENEEYILTASGAKVNELAQREAIALLN